MMEKEGGDFLFEEEPQHQLQKQQQKDRITTNATFSQVPYSRLMERVTKGSRVVVDLHNVMKGRLECIDKDLSFSNRVSRTNIYEGEIFSSTSEKSVGMLKNYFLYLAKEQEELRKTFDESLVKDIECFKLTRAKFLSQHQEQYEKAVNEVDTAYSKLDIAKAKSQYVQKTLIESQEKLNLVEEEIKTLKQASPSELKKREEKNIMGRMLSSFQNTPEQEREKQTKKVKKLHFELTASIDEISKRRKELLEKIRIRDGEIDRATIAYQKCERDRLDKGNLSLKKFCAFEREYVNIRLKLLQDFEDAVHEVDTERDLSFFIAAEKLPEDTHKYAKVLSLLDWHVKDSTLMNSYRGGSRSMSSGSNSTGVDIKLSNVESPPLPSHASRTVSVDRPTFEVDLLSSLHESLPSRDSKSAARSMSVGDANSQHEKEIVTATMSDEGQEGWKDKGGGGGGEEDVQSDRERKSNSIGNNDSGNSVQSNQMTESNRVLIASCMDAILGSQEEKTGEKEGEDGGEDIIAASNDSSSSNSKDEAIGEHSVETMIAKLKTTQFLFGAYSNREFFLRRLDLVRGEKALLKANRFQLLAIVMLILLDDCSSSQDISSALRAANMANTFYQVAPYSSEIDDTGGGTICKHCECRSSSCSCGAKVYIINETAFREHKLWRSKEFWEDALDLTVKGQIAMQDVLHWDDLTQTALVETVISTHNLIFGQLISLAFTMHELGLGFDEVVIKVDELGKKFDLSEEQRIELLKSVMRNFNSINSNDKDADDDNVHHHRDGIEDNDGDGAASKIASSAELELEN